MNSRLTRGTIGTKPRGTRLCPRTVFYDPSPAESAVVRAPQLPVQVQSVRDVARRRRVADLHGRELGRGRGPSSRRRRTRRGIPGGRRRSVDLRDGGLARRRRRAVTRRLRLRLAPAARGTAGDAREAVVFRVGALESGPAGTRLANSFGVGCRVAAEESLLVGVHVLLSRHEHPAVVSRAVRRVDVLPVRAYPQRLVEELVGPACDDAAPARDARGIRRGRSAPQYDAVGAVDVAPAVERGGVPGPGAGAEPVRIVRLRRREAGGQSRREEAADRPR